MSEPMTAAAADVFAHHFTVAQHQAVHYDPDRATRFHSKMADLRARYPNQWVVYTDRTDDPAAQTWRVSGPFADERTAVDWGMTLPPAERSAWTVCFVEASANTGERVNHPQPASA